MTDVLARVPLPTGEARCVYDGPTSRVLEVDLGGRVLRETWDPRDSGVVLYATPTTWTEPAGVQLTPDDVAAVLDALWTLAPHTGGVRAIISYERASACQVVRRWDRGDTGLLVRVENDYVDVLELGRTARVPTTADHAVSPSIAVLRWAEARWLHPAGAMTDDDRARLVRRLGAAQGDDFGLTDRPWRFEAA